jgi:HAD superfamily hydrolase (TIGR01490 family)
MSRMVFFDLDRTILAADSEITLARRLVAERAVPIWTMVKILVGYLRYRVTPSTDLLDLKYQLLKRLLAGRDVATLEAIARHVVQQELIGCLAPAGLEALKRHRALGDRLVLLSAAVDLIVEPIASALGIDTAVCTRLVREDSRFTGDVEGTMPMGIGKATALRETCERYGVDPRTAIAYADHYSDRHMLQIVGTQVVVNPGKKLSALARAKGWRIERWSAPGASSAQPLPVGR